MVEILVVKKKMSIIQEVSNSKVIHYSRHVDYPESTNHSGTIDNSVNKKHNVI